MAEQDDWYYPYRLEKQITYMEENLEVGMVSGIAEFFDGEKVIFRMPGLLVKGNQYPEDPIEMFKWNYRNGPKVTRTCMVIRKSIHIDNGLYFSQHFRVLPIDWLYILRFSLVAPIRGLNMPLVRLDRRLNRNSATTNRKDMYRGSRELIRSMYWENSNLLTRKDFNYAMNSQILNEGKNHNLPYFFLKLAEALRHNTFDSRYLDYFAHLYKRIKLRRRKYKYLYPY
ncbi:hypothetical protein BH23BAC1_BH23BAC1_43090 [soil metagenome]